MNYNLISECTEKMSIIDRVLYNRGIPMGEAYHYLNTTNSDIINPLLLDNIEQGAKLLIKHIQSNNKIFV